MSNVGSPDWQRGVINAEKLLATVAANTGTVDVTVPANTTTIMVVNSGSSIATTNNCYCLGMTSGILYPGSLRQYSPGIAAFYARFFTVSPAIDGVMTISWQVAPTVTWYVVAMSGVNVVDDPAMDMVVSRAGFAPSAFGQMAYGSDGTDARALSTDTNGRQIPLVPNESTGIVNVPSIVSTIIPAPSSGRIYIYGVDMDNTGGGVLLLYGNGTQIANIDIATWGQEATLEGYAISTALTGKVNNSATNIIVRYAFGP